MTRDDVDIIEKTTPFEGYFRIDSYRLRHRLFEGPSDRTTRDSSCQSLDSTSGRIPTRFSRSRGSATRS